MARAVGFLDEAHELRFRAAGVATRFGGPDAVVCGARLRGGGRCRQRPPADEKRCVLHGGPAAAHRHRERQRLAYERGELDAEAWLRAERRRAANRVKYQWRRDPWRPGATITLDGDAERQFRFDLSAGGFDVDKLAPAVADWLRWRWTRLLHDRHRPTEWADLPRNALPARVRAAGPRPEGCAAEGAAGAVAALFEVGGRAAAFSKRGCLDRPRPAATEPPGRRRSAKVTVPDAALDAVLVEHRAMLRRLAGDDAGGLRALASVLAAHLADPDDPAAARQWRDAVTARRCGG